MVDLISLLAHIFAGFLTALSIKIKKIFGVLGFLGFMLYEFVQWYAINDPFFPEIREYMFGFFLGVVILIYLNRDDLKDGLNNLIDKF